LYAGRMTLTLGLMRDVLHISENQIILHRLTY
jgi:hypothetical protein